MQTVLVVRHGETAWNRDGRIQGWAPVRLSERGREQARDLAPAIADWRVDRFVASDLERARETATLLADEAPLPEPSFDRAFRERDIGRYQGFEKGRLAGRDGPDLGDVDVAPPGGESLATMADRVEAGLADHLASLPADGTLLLVAHGGPIRTLLGLAHGQSLQRAQDGHDPANCSLTVLASDGEALRPGPAADAGTR